MYRFRFVVAAYMLLASTSLLSCQKVLAQSQHLLEEGKNSFIFNAYKPFQNRPIRVWYYNPNNPDPRMLIVMHGNSRAAESYLDALVAYAEKNNYLLITPEFDKEQFPSSRDYHQGGVFKSDGEKKEKADWTFSLIEPLFDYIKDRTDYGYDTYWLYGFSAGSQFVHRFMMFCPENRASQIVSAAAGTYTTLDPNVAYSYGLKNTDIPLENFKHFFAKDFTVAVGDADTVLSRKDLVKTPIANRQGRDRVERALNFYNMAADLAKEYQVPFKWKLKLVPHVGHSQADMSPWVATLFEDNKE